MNFDRFCMLMVGLLASTSVGAVILTKRKYDEERRKATGMEPPARGRRR